MGEPLNWLFGRGEKKSQINSRKVCLKYVMRWNVKVGDRFLPFLSEVYWNILEKRNYSKLDGKEARRSDNARIHLYVTYRLVPNFCTARKAERPLLCQLAVSSGGTVIFFPWIVQGTLVSWLIFDWMGQMSQHFDQWILQSWMTTFYNWFAEISFLAFGIFKMLDPSVLV